MNHRVVRHQWHAADNYTIVRQYYSDIWIYGDRSFYDLSLDLTAGTISIPKNQFSWISGCSVSAIGVTG